MKPRSIKREVALWNAGKLSIGQLTWPLWLLYEAGAR